MRVAEVVAALAAAADLGIGLPMDHGLRTVLVAQALADVCGLDVDEREDLFYLTLLRMAGCTVESSTMAFHFGDEVEFGTDTQALDYGNYEEFGAWIQAHFASDQDASTRQAMLERVFQYTPSKRREKIAGHCEVAQLLAGQIGLGARVKNGLKYVFERWDGHGAPNQVGGEDIPLIARIMNLANELEVHVRLFGPGAAVKMAEHRAGGAFDPYLVRLLCRDPARVFAALDATSTWDAAMAADPGKRPMDVADLDRACIAIASFADLKSDYTHAHSTGVARLVETAASGAGMTVEEVSLIRRSALVHDLGRASVSAATWDKPSPLSDAEWERVRLHA